MNQGSWTLDIVGQPKTRGERADPLQFRKGMPSEIDLIRSSFRLQFDDDLTPESLDRLLLRHQDPRKVRSFVQNIHADVLDRLGILDWAYCNAASGERADELKDAIKTKIGPDHFHFLRVAQQFVSMMQSSTEYDKICKARDFFAKYADLQLGPFQLRGCRTVEQM
jgi:hypothetical protein